MELPIAIIVLGLVGAVALAGASALGSRPVWARRIAGVILVGLGLALLGSQLPPTSGRLLFGSVMLVAWGSVGLALIAGRTCARVPGLVLAGIGFAVAAWVDVRVDAWANEAWVNGLDWSAGDRVLVDAFFTADGPSLSWLEITYGSMAFAALSAAAGGLLALDLLQRGRHRSSPPVEGL
jgi:hypothetical protein